AARSGDSAVVLLRVTDNIQNVFCDIQGSSLAGLPTQPPAADGTVSFTVRNARDSVRGLWFQATATDGHNTTRLPRTGGRHHLPQAWNKVSTPPETYSIGNPKNPWDMVGLPLGASTSLTVKQLKVDNDEPSLTVFSRMDGKSEALVDGDVLEPGVAYWFASKRPRPYLTISNLSTPAPDSDGVFRVRLRPEGNLIANPSLDILYWPISRAHPNYNQNRIRGLWGYSNESLDWAQRDFLEPWQGYWVWNYVEHDTTVALSTSPVLITPGAGALKAAAEPEVELQLDFGRSFPLYLGALPYGQDGVGVEDEPVLPAWGNQREAWTIRDQKRLMTDVVRFRADQAMRWRLALKGPPPGREAPVRVVESRMPPGFEAWAWSPSRNFKVRLQRLAAWTVAGPETDTMVVIAGPSAKLASLPELARAVEEIKEFSAGVRMGKGGARLRLALPGEGLVQAELLSLSGRRLATVHSGRLGTGMHDLAVPATGAGIAILRVRVQGTGWSGERIHKLAR
ncbi:MAG TPA: hypothetical protein VK465_13385, partial [Fibrobacteria bacterium]|nr:hypothetical protein [Fibrobacteria bacterium]